MKRIFYLRCKSVFVLSALLLIASIQIGCDSTSDSDNSGNIEVITEESTALGERHRHLFGFEGFIAIKAWLGEPDDPENEYSCTGWILAIEELPYQRSNFVTPTIVGYISGTAHSAGHRPRY